MNDFESIFDELDKKYAEKPEEESEDETEDETEEEEVEDSDETEDESEESEDETEEEDEGSEEGTSDDRQSDSRAREGFIKLRKQTEALTKQLNDEKSKVKFFEDLAQRNGLSLDDLIKRYEEAELQRNAKEQKVPVEVLRKQKELTDSQAQMKAQLEAMNQEKWATAFNSAYAQFLKNVSLTEDETAEFFQKATEKGINFMQNPTAESIKYAYYTVYPEKFEEITRQSVLRKQKNAQKKAPLSPSGTGAVGKDSEAEMDAFLKDFFAGTQYEEKMKKKG